MNQATLIISATAGIPLGISANYLTRILVKKRSCDSYSVWYINKSCSTVLWALCFSAYYALAALLLENINQLIPVAILFFACSCISAVDALIRKIPNSMLLIILANTVLYVILNYATEDIWNMFLSMLIGVLVFSIPSYFGKYIGWGDVKYAAVLALYLSLLGFCVSIIIMGASTAVYALLLKAKSKNNFKETLKTSVPMGPFISFGVIITAIVPLFYNI
ncbi:MAG: prepilin peptidase [Oscillospiraceae bacterium]|nr:prepilin peptidase [Oscillospiraceae bacterium]